MTRWTKRGAPLAAALLATLIPDLAHATTMPGIGEVTLLLTIVAVVVGLIVAGIVVLIVGLVSRSKGKPKAAGYLVKLGLIVFAAFPVTVLLAGLLLAIVSG